MSDESNLTFGVVRIGQTSIGISIENLSEVFHISGGQKLPIKSDLLEGGVNLRGRLVPVLNLSQIGDFGDQDTTKRLGFVLEHGQKSLALYVDEIIGIANIHQDQIGKVTRQQTDQSAFFSSVFPFENQFVAILDVVEVFAIPGVLTTNRTEGGGRVVSDKGPPMLTFCAGDALYSIPAVEVHAAVPKQQIEETAITSGPCLGEISYHDRRIPVICPVTILGLGKRQKNTASEVVVLRFTDDLLLGIAVESIRNIRTFHTAKEARIPVWQDGPNFIEKVLVHDEGKQTYVIDVDLLRATKQMADIAGLSKIEPDQRSKSDLMGANVAGNVIKEREPYLIVDLHKRIAVPLLQVTCIVGRPKNLTPTDLNRDGFRGYFSRLGESVALIDLRERLGAGQVQGEEAKVLMTGASGAQIGFLVDYVVGIELSQWRENKTEAAANKEEPVVQLGSGDNAGLFPLFDLDGLIDVPTKTT